MQDRLVGAVAAAPDSATPIEAVGAALEAAADLLHERRDHARRRQAVIAANAELRERELIKFASLSAALAETLRRRRLDDPAAGLTAEIAMAVFRVAFERWIDEAEDRDLPELIRESLGQLTVLTAGA